MSTPRGPESAHALVVGIEQYDMGASWNLSGPALDAARFVRWLRGRGVPAANIALFAAPLPENASEVAALDVPAQPADSKTIADALSTDFANRHGDVLFVFWGGHGLIDHDSRRLFFSDVAPNLLRSWQLPALQYYLRSLGNFPKQVYFADACAEYFELMSAPIGLADLPLPTAALNQAVEQFGLYATSPGEAATNLNALRTGAFSRALLEELARAPVTPWPPDLIAIRAAVETQMVSLRAQGLARQTPVTYSFSDWKGNTGTLSDSNVRVRAPGKEVTLAVRDQILEAMLRCACMRTPVRRDQIVADLRPDIAHTINRDPATATDIAEIIRTAAGYSGGFLELIYRVVKCERGSDAGRALEALAKELQLDI